MALGWSGDVQVVADQVAAAPKAQAVLLGGADPEDVLVVGDQVAAAQGAMVALVRQSGYQWWLVM